MAWTDAQLVNLTLAGDREAFGELIQRYRRLVFLLALEQGFPFPVAEEIALEVFLDAFRNLAQLREPAAFERWIGGRVEWVAAKHVRKAGPGSAADWLETTAAGPECTDDIRAALEVLNVLSAEQRWIVTLHYLQGLSPQEIALKSGLPRGTVRRHLHQALLILEKALPGRSAPTGSDRRVKVGEPLP